MCSLLAVELYKPPSNIQYNIVQSVLLLTKSLLWEYCYAPFQQNWKISRKCNLHMIIMYLTFQFLFIIPVQSCL